jgi:hypothetical protein
MEREPKPPKPAMDDEWLPYTGLIEPDMIPDYGIQVFTYVDTKGRRGYKWMTTGDSSIEEVVMMLERVKFLIQFRAEIVDLGNLSEEDED